MNRQIIDIIQQAGILLPEVWLLVLGTIVLLTGIFKNENRYFISFLAIAGLLANYAIIFITSTKFPAVSKPTFFIGNSMAIYQHSYFFEYIFTTSALLAITLGLFGKFNQQIRNGEYTGLLIFMLLGLHLLVKPASFLMLYLSIELVSFCAYLLTFFKSNKISAEGSLKYLLFGAFSTACMLYGISLVYAFTGSLTLDALQQMANSAGNMAGILAGGLILVGLIFKLAAFPFQVWSPDAYQAAPTPFVSFLSVAPKVGSIYILSILWQNLDKNEASYVFFEFTLAIVAIGSIFLGNLNALWQKNAKRLLAYSSIAHTGFLLIPIFYSHNLQIEGLLFYVVIFLLMNTAAFSWVHFMEIKLSSNKIAIIKGCGKVQPYPAVLLLVIMISLTGLPMTAGFTAKLFIFSGLWQSIGTGSSLLVVLFFTGLLNVVIALYYYLQFPFIAFFKNPPVTSLPLLLNKKQIGFLSFLTLPLLIFFFKPDWLFRIIEVMH